MKESLQLLGAGLWLLCLLLGFLFDMFGSKKIANFFIFITFAPLAIIVLSAIGFFAMYAIYTGIMGLI